MAQVPLPSGDSPSLILTHPTTPEIIRQTEASGEMWRGALDMEAFMRRETYLASQDALKNGGVTAWALINPGHNGERCMLSGCESFRKRMLVARDGNVEEKLCHGVGSVFSNPAHRGRGYAARMMRELGPALRSWQIEHGQPACSILFSDIGKSFYAKAGWLPFPSSHISLLPSHQKDDHQMQGRHDNMANVSQEPYLEQSFTRNSEVKPLYAKDLPTLCETDEKLLRHGLTTTEGVVAALVPNASTMALHHARMYFVAEELFGLSPRVVGAITTTPSGIRVWCYWASMWYNEDTRQVKGNTLHILRVVADDQAFVNGQLIGRDGEDESHAEIEEAISRLLTTAQQEAFLWRMETVELWNPSKPFVAAAQRIDSDLTVTHRETKSITSLLWYDRLENEEQGQTRVRWVGNEKYGWC